MVELIVAVCGDDECGNRVDPASDDAQDVKSGFVGPVDVLDDDDRDGMSLQLSHERRGDFMRTYVALHEFFQVAACHPGKIDQGAERTWCKQRVTGAPQHSRVSASLVAELSHERRFPDSGLPSDKGEPAARTDSHSGKRVGERFELAIRSSSSVLLPAALATGVCTLSSPNRSHRFQW